jgi:hypothetical protein
MCRFAPTMSLPLDAPRRSDDVIHEHVAYPWPPDSTTLSIQTDHVLSAVTSADTFSNLAQLQDPLLPVLVRAHLRAFAPCYFDSRVLRLVYICLRDLSAEILHRVSIEQALRLLFLVHAGGNMTLPSRCENKALAQLIDKHHGRR